MSAQIRINSRAIYTAVSKINELKKLSVSRATKIAKRILTENYKRHMFSKVV